MERADWHIYQVLTKRSSLLQKFTNERYSGHRPVPVELAQGENFAVQRRHKAAYSQTSRLLPSTSAKTEQRLPGIGAIQQRQRTIELAAQQNHPSLPAPPHQP